MAFFMKFLHLINSEETEQKTPVGEILKILTNAEHMRTRLRLSENEKLWEHIFDLLSDLRKAIRARKLCSPKIVNETNTIRLLMKCKKLYVSDLKKLQDLLLKYNTPQLLVEQVCKEYVAAKNAHVAAKNAHVAAENAHVAALCLLLPDVRQS